MKRRKPQPATEVQAQAGSSPRDLRELEALLGHRFTRPELLTLALTHRSFVYDASQTAPANDLADPARDNEQLEFVGDAALGLLAAEALCNRFPASREGELTRLRASIVSRRHLGEVGTRLDLGRWLRLGHTAEKNEGRQNAALFANAVEALIAALYIDGGLEVARRFVDQEIVIPAVPALQQSLGQADRFAGAVGDHKSALQEMLQAQGLGRPEYRLIAESGPDHKRLFRVEVLVEGPESKAIAEAEGTTKKQAQQEAARLAVLALAGTAPGGTRAGQAERQLTAGPAKRKKSAGRTDRAKQKAEPEKAAPAKGAASA